MNEMECDICKKEYPESDLIIGYGIRHEIENLIVTDHPGWNDSNRICKNDFNMYRVKYISSIIDEEKGSIKDLEAAVLTSIKENELLSSNTNTAVKEILTIGDRISDKNGSFWRKLEIYYILLHYYIQLDCSQHLPHSAKIF